jgi:hypothetical protein
MELLALDSLRYSPKCLEGEFCELRELGILRTSPGNCPKSRMGGELVPCQLKKKALSGLHWVLHATEDPLSIVLLRLFSKSLHAIG